MALATFRRTMNSGEQSNDAVELVTEKGSYIAAENRGCSAFMAGEAWQRADTPHRQVSRGEGMNKDPQ